MSIEYHAVQWNRHKKIYDLLLITGVVLFIAIFMGVGLLRWQGTEAANPVTLLMRATSTCAITMLSFILMIGPAARLSPRFSPLLYNRRHFGVTMFLVALVHGTVAVFWYHAYGVVNPIVSVFTSNARYDSLSGFPFQPLGVFALTILFVMAATSHDFWLKNLTPAVWKTLHTFVYLAYALVVMHVTLGFLQDEVSPVYPLLLDISAVVIIALHVVTGVREWRLDSREAGHDAGDGWIDIGEVDDIEMNAAMVVAGAGCERIAVFRHEGGLSAVSNVCAHQNGPLGEGRIVDGCITCPWHGYQYLAHNGQSPPPFTEKIPTFDIRVEGRRILLNPKANPPGTAVTPAAIPDDSEGSGA